MSKIKLVVLNNINEFGTKVNNHLMKKNKVKSN